MSGYELMKFIHVVAAVVWVGGDPGDEKDLLDAGLHLRVGDALRGDQLLQSPTS